MKTYFIIILITLVCSSSCIFNKDNIEEISVTVNVNEPVNLYIESKFDDLNLKDPNVYWPGIISGFFNKKIIIENIGQDKLEDFILILNNKDLSTFESIAKYLELESDTEKAIKTLYSFWKDHRFHASSFMGANNNPFYALNFWGYTLCGNDANALVRLFSYLGILARPIHLNGHAVNEYFFSDKWNVMDGDQNIVYLKLDNKTLASFDEIINDPFIALRTKVYGVKYNLANSCRNTALFEFIQPKKKDIIKIGKIADLENNKFTLYPGEKIIFHHDEAPPYAIGKKDISHWKGARDISLAKIELILNPKIRAANKKSNIIRIDSRYPIYKIESTKAGNEFTIPKGKLIFSRAINIGNNSDDKLTVLCQGARASFSGLLKGQNEIVLKSKTGKGKAKITFIYNPLNENFSLPKIWVKNLSTVFHYEIPYFAIGGSEHLEKLWWQISDTKDFHFVPPNFENIQAFSKIIKLDKIIDSFFREKEAYFFRVKGKKNGVWGNWSPVFRFKVLKPKQPQSVKYDLLADGKIRLEWKGSSEENVEYMIFGSDRLDFIPDIYCNKKVTEMLYSEIVSSRLNKNIISVTNNNYYVTDIHYPFYRIVARSGRALSTPSSIINLYSNSTSEKLYTLPPKVLQMRHSKIKDSGAKLGYKDIYRAVEMELR